MKPQLTTRLALACILSFTAAPLLAQSSVAYPNVEKRLELAPGDTVLLFNRFLNDGGPAMRPPGKRLDLQYGTRIPVSDSIARMQQADRAAEYFGPEAIELGVRRLSIGICDTRACAERRHPPSAWYLYERSATGWRRLRS